MGAFKLLHGRASGSSASASLTVGTSANRQLASTAMAQLLTFPAANTITVAKTSAGAGLVQLTRGHRFDLAPVLMGAPAAGYTGVEGTGWPSGVRPTQPTLSSVLIAPSLRFITLANNRFTGTHDVVVQSDQWADIASVDFKVEGTTVNVTSPTWVYYTDVNGIQRSVWGWACRLTASNYTGFATDATRGIEVVAVANPQAALGASWTTRVIGIGSSIYRRHVLFPATQHYGALVYIDPTLGAPVYPTFTTAGVDVEAKFPTWTQAKQYASGVLTSTRTCSAPGGHVRIHVVGASPTVAMDSDGDYTATHAQTPRGFYQITHDAGATVTWQAPGGTTLAPIWEPGLRGIEWLGIGHQIDHTHFGGFNAGPFGTNDKYWFRANGIGQDQCLWNMFDHLDDSRNARNAPVNGALMFREMVDCDHVRWHMHSESNVSGDLAGMVYRNVTKGDISADDLNNGMMSSFGLRIINAGSKPWRTPYVAITLKWIGGGSPGFVSRPGGGAVKFWAADGVTRIGTDLDISGGGDFPHLCNLINNVGGIGQATIAASFQAVNSMTTSGDRTRDRDMTYLDWGGGTAVDGQPGTFTGQNNNFNNSQVPISAGTPTQFFSFMDIHMDLYQSFLGQGGWANAVQMNMQCWGLWGLQTPFYDWPVTAYGDCNQFIDNDAQSAGAAGITGDLASFYNSRYVNISNARSTINFADSAGTGWTDAFCKFRSMVFANLTYKSSGDKTANTSVVDSYFSGSNANSAPATNTNVKTGLGDYTTTYPGLSARDPRPAGALLTNLVAPQMPFDAWGVESSTTVPMGAKYQEPIFATCTGSEAAELAVVALGADTCTYTISGYLGVGNTGTLLTLTLNVTGVDN